MLGRNELINLEEITIAKEAAKEGHRTQKIVKNCQHFHSRFIPSPWLVSGHLQTVGAAKIRQTPHLDFEREQLFMEDGGFITLDWISIIGEEKQQMVEEIASESNPRVSKSFQSMESKASIVRSKTTVPTVIVIAGLTGGSNESYVRHAVSEAKNQKFNCVAFNYRGAADTHLATPIAYSGAQTDDLRALVKHVRAVLPTSPLFGIGFSLGSNILSKYVGEEGDKCILSGAVSISNPFKFVEAADVLNGHWFLRNVYSKALGTNLKNFLKRHKDMLGRNELINLEEIDKTIFMREFDDHFTRKIYGFKSVNDYYTEASSATRLKNIAIPYLALNALDDPISPSVCIPYEEFESNPNLILITTKRGGHTGWLQGWNLFSLNNSWMDKVAFEFIAQVIKTANKNE
eukprot:TRINITY_DN3832_c0_g2_i2.p1 TRINITY_DN3832_c0_g2~~TRINITY_DN3832_c0_g2_i2.p1  ORF type:complete len:403 (+),score=150.56 TRINITY_DN3832_c0_g2_i2:264-1472(+)